MIYLQKKIKTTVIVGDSTEDGEKTVCFLDSKGNFGPAWDTLSHFLESGGWREENGYMCEYVNMEILGERGTFSFNGELSFDSDPMAGNKSMIDILRKFKNQSVSISLEIATNKEYFELQRATLKEKKSIASTMKNIKKPSKNHKI